MVTVVNSFANKLSFSSLEFFSNLSIGSIESLISSLKDFIDNELKNNS